jgi:outer membrane cobalamin receptor
MRCLLLATATLGFAGAPAPERGGDALRPAEGRAHGLVLDASGAPVPGAIVSVEVGGRIAGVAVTGPDERAAPVRFLLQPARLAETLSVTATRGVPPLTTPESVSVLTASDLLTSPAGTLDDALRATPGFSLFRRSSSRVANPTTQGVTLRGVSGSGASRTLVLADGLPLNDPFGSWVYWNRVPQAAVERVEVARGAFGDLYGPDALGGVVQILTHAPDRPRLRAIVDAASHGTARLSAFGSGQSNGWTGSLAGDWLATEGVPVVARDVARTPVRNVGWPRTLRAGLRLFLP